MSVCVVYMYVCGACSVYVCACVVYMCVWYICMYVVHLWWCVYVCVHMWCLRVCVLLGILVSKSTLAVTVILSLCCCVPGIQATSTVPAILTPLVYC